MLKDYKLNEGMMKTFITYAAIRIPNMRPKRQPQTPEYTIGLIIVFDYGN